MVTVYHLNAFVKKGIGGNPAGVCLDSAGLSEQDMQSIAAKVGFSETAFVHGNGSGRFKVRFFTPVKEVALCGHATIAAFYLLAQQGIVGKGSYTQETKAGTLGVEIGESMVYMSQNRPRSLGSVPKEEVEECLDIKLNNDLPVEVISTGEPTIIVPVPSLESLFGIKPNFGRIKLLEQRHHNGLLYVFTTETIAKESTAHARMFAPLDGINEEAATGVASGALACYMYRHGLARNPLRFVFEQGYCLGSPSEILGRLKIRANQISDVTIGGAAVVKGTINV